MIILNGCKHRVRHILKFKQSTALLNNIKKAVKHGRKNQI